MKTGAGNPPEAQLNGAKKRDHNFRGVAHNPEVFFLVGQYTANCVRQRGGWFGPELAPPPPGHPSLETGRDAWGGR